MGAQPPLPRRRAAGHAGTFGATGERAHPRDARRARGSAAQPVHRDARGQALAGVEAELDDEPVDGVLLGGVLPEDEPLDEELSDDEPDVELPDEELEESLEGRVLDEPERLSVR